MNAIRTLRRQIERLSAEVARRNVITGRNRIAVIGAGGHGKVVSSILIAAGHRIVGFYDDDPKKWRSEIFGFPVLGPISELTSNRCSHAVIGIGDNNTRKQLSEQIDVNWLTAIHPFSWIHPDVSIGVGTVVCAGAIVQPFARIGSHAIINTRASVDHDCTVGDFVHVAAACLSGGSSVGEGAFVCNSIPNLSNPSNPSNLLSSERLMALVLEANRLCNIVKANATFRFSFFMALLKLLRT